MEHSILRCVLGQFHQKLKSTTNPGTPSRTPPVPRSTLTWSSPATTSVLFELKLVSLLSTESQYFLKIFFIYHEEPSQNEYLVKMTVNLKAQTLLLQFFNESDKLESQVLACPFTNRTLIRFIEEYKKGSGVHNTSLFLLSNRKNSSISNIKQLKNVINFSTLLFKRHLSVGEYFDADLNLTLPAHEISRQAQVNNSSLTVLSKMLTATKTCRDRR